MEHKPDTSDSKPGSLSKRVQHFPLVFLGGEDKPIRKVIFDKTL